MPATDPTNYPLLTYLWVLALSTWGGVVNFIQKVRSGESQRWSITELFGEVVISAFAGIMTFYLCEASGFDQLITAALVGISGHMGSRAIFMLEKYAKSRFMTDGQ